MAEQFKVNAMSLNFRSAPSSVDASNIIATLPTGQIVTKLQVASTSTDWWEVSTILDGQTKNGFVSHKFLDLVDLKYKVIADSLNLRSAPVVDQSNLIKALPKGQIVTKLEVAPDENWWKVSTTLTDEKLEGFVANRFLSSLNDPFEGKKVVGMDNTSQAFRDKLVQIAERLQTRPLFLMAVMSFETGGTFSPSVKNRVSGATGLIQFMPPTAIGLGTSINALVQMTALEQLDFVEKHYKPFRGRLDTLEDAYMAVLYPKAVGKGRQYVLFREGTIAYEQNKGLDINRNGKVTVAEAATLVASRII